MAVILTSGSGVDVNLAELLRYNDELGELFWLPRPRKLFMNKSTWGAFSQRFAGKPALTAVSQSGYRRGRIFDSYYFAHRVAWALFHGDWPEGFIDHIDGDTRNNRISNLRDVSNAENHRNVKRHSNNRSGHTGVCWDARRQNWRATIFVNYTQIHIGAFDHIEDAVAARARAESLYNFHENHGRAA